MTITTSDMGGNDRREQTLKAHRDNLLDAIANLGVEEAIEAILFRNLVLAEGDRTSAARETERQLAVAIRTFINEG